MSDSVQNETVSMQAKQPSDSPSSRLELPAALRAQFTAFEKRLRRADTRSAIGIGGCGLLLSILILFVSDRIWDTPPWLRFGFQLAGISALIGALFFWSKNWVFRRRDDRALACLVQKRFPRLGDRLLGIVELTQENDPDSEFSPALGRAAVRQVANDAGTFEFTEAVNDRPPRRRLMQLGACALIIAAIMVLAPGAGWNACLRWGRSLADLPRYTLLQIQGLQEQRIVAHGEPFSLNCNIYYQSIWKPGRASVKVAGYPRRQVPVIDGRLRCDLPGFIQEDLVRVRIGDARAQIRIKPVHRPTLKQLTARIQLPSYLQYPELSQSAKSGSMTLLQGSRIALHGEINRPLSEVVYQLGDQVACNAPFNELTFQTPLMDPANAFHCTFTWKDHWGLTGDHPWRLTFAVENDEPVNIQMLDLPPEVALLANEVLIIPARARDDYGVREMGLMWDYQDPLSPTNAPLTGFQVAAENSQQQTMDHSFTFSPSTLKIPVDAQVKVHVFATDYYPDRPPSISRSIRIRLLDIAEHAEWVRENLEAILTQLEDVSRLEENILLETLQTKESGEEELASDAIAERLGDLEEQQLQNSAKLEQLAMDGAKTLRDALRNPSFSKDTLQQWTENLQSMQSVAQGAMSQSSQSLQSAQQNDSERRDNLETAAQNQEEALQQLQELQGEVNADLDQLQAETLAQRLRKTGRSEEGIEERIQDVASAIIGLPRSELSPYFKRHNDQLASHQTATTAGVEVLQSEISRYFERTQRPNYGEVSQEMHVVDTVGELQRVQELIAKNISMEASRNLIVWAERFHRWADALQPPEEESGSGSGGGGAGEENNTVKIILGLLRLRENEINLRAQTQALDGQADRTNYYRDQARSLRDSQRRVLEEMIDIHGELVATLLESPSSEAQQAMLLAEQSLTLPETGAVVEQPQTKAIDVLTDMINLINENQQRASGSPSPSEQQMAFLMQMMAMSETPTDARVLSPFGGTQMNEGSTDLPSPDLPGDPRGKDGDPRHSGRASGSSEREPSEFQEALRNYFRAVEQEN